MTYDELDNLLEGYVNTGNEETSDINFDPSQITDSMSAFISKQSSILKGAEVPNRYVHMAPAIRSLWGQNFPLI